MGDRGNIRLDYVSADKVSDEVPQRSVWLYTHWSGTELPRTVAKALDRGRSRWGDSPYLARIIFSELIKGDEQGTTGYGIDVACGDGGNQVVIVNLEDETVEHKGRGGPVSFEEWISQHGGG